MSGGKFGNDKFDCNPEFSEPVEALVMADLRPMASAPHDGTEILAYHKEGRNFHPVSWKDWRWMDGGVEFWGMRWHEEYRQHDNYFMGWVPYPKIEP